MSNLNIESESWCRKAYLNYHCYGNSMGLSSKDMNEITTQWSSSLQSWQESVSNDDNVYEFDDSQFELVKDDSKKEIKDRTGYDGKTDISSAVVDTVIAPLSAVGTPLNWDAYWITAPLALAVGTLYMTNRPNKEGKEAADEMKDVFAEAQDTLNMHQDYMEVMSEELMDLSDEAHEINEDDSDAIDEKKDEYDTYIEILTEIQDKIDSGEPLTDDEKEVYESVMEYLGETAEDLEDLIENNTETIGNIFEEIGEYQSEYDDVASSMAEIEGQTDFAESFDVTTQRLCITEGTAQTTNAAGGTLAALQAAANSLFQPWAWAFVAMGTAGAAMSTVGAAEQFKCSNSIGKEIDIRQETQDLNSVTNDIYSEEIDSFDGFMQGVEELELEVPEEITPDELDTQVEEGTTELSSAKDEGDEKSEESGLTMGGTAAGTPAAGLPQGGNQGISTISAGAGTASAPAAFFGAFGILQRGNPAAPQTPIFGAPQGGNPAALQTPIFGAPQGGNPAAPQTPIFGAPQGGNPTAPQTPIFGAPQGGNPTAPQTPIFGAPQGGITGTGSTFGSFGILQGGNQNTPQTTTSAMPQGFNNNTADGIKDSGSEAPKPDSDDKKLEK